MATDPLPEVHDDDPYYYEDDYWPELDAAYEDYDDEQWNREVDYQWATR